MALWNGKGQRGSPKQSRTCHSFLGGKPLGENPAGCQLPAVHLLRHLPLGLLRLTQGEPWTRSSLCVFSALLFFLTIENKMIIKLVFVYHEASEVLLTTQLAFSSRKDLLALELLSLWHLLLLRLYGKHTCVPCPDTSCTKNQGLCGDTCLESQPLLN